MPPKLLDPEGALVDPTDLRLRRAQELHECLTDGSVGYVSFVECRRLDRGESVVFDVELELPQERAHPVQPRERLQVVFDQADTVPEVLALRADFPLVPHLNLRRVEYPRSLCLYDQPFREIKRRWTAARFVEEIRQWFALTALGRLHAADQLLEPFVSDVAGQIVLPPNLEAASSEAGYVALYATRDDPARLFVLAGAPASGELEPKLFVATTCRCEPRQHGLIRHCPENLAKLSELANEAGIDLPAHLRGFLRKWKDAATDGGARLLGAHLIIIMEMPKQRTADGPVESTETRCFVVPSTLREIGTAIGVWESQNQQIGYLIPTDVKRTGGDLPLILLNRRAWLDRQTAALLNGIMPATQPRIVAVGMGALGSQVVANLARSGFGTWTLVDDDDLLPHNLARHLLLQTHVGWPKASAVAHFANLIIGNEPAAFQSVVADVLAPREDDRVRLYAALSEADCVLDMSASVAVSRHLSQSSDSRARRMSLFLNPAGTDLVLLAEDRQRTVSLNALEMQYYRAVSSAPELTGHFSPPDARQRYGQSCRDLSITIPHDLIALHAGIASRIVRESMLADDARISIWRADAERNVRHVRVPVSAPIAHRIGEWTIVTDQFLVDRLFQLRAEKLPNETGGVLLGSLDLDARVAYIVDTIPSPPDSEEWPTLYIRGKKGLRAEVQGRADATDGMLEYVGEWHSHPRRSSTEPSRDDLNVFVWLTEIMNRDGVPGTMMIVGDRREVRIFLGPADDEDAILKVVFE